MTNANMTRKHPALGLFSATTSMIPQAISAMISPIGIKYFKRDNQLHELALAASCP
jgi:hypothetical protein